MITVNCCGRELDVVQVVTTFYYHQIQTKDVPHGDSFEKQCHPDQNGDYTVPNRTTCFLALVVGQ
jgi:hypothetical protein